jgi:hypothetical protein
MKPPFVPMLVAVTRAVPSGFVIETLRLPVVDVPIVTLLTFRLTRWPAVPANVSVAFSLATVVVTVTGAPPATML